ACEVQLRAHGEVYGCTAEADGDGLRVRLDRPARGVAPGQAAVLYDGDRVLAAATIADTARVPACSRAGESSRERLPYGRVDRTWRRAVEFGVSTFVTDDGIAPAALGRALEERGFGSLFLAEHTHIPVKRESPWPGGGELPRPYYRTLDPFVALTAAATVTERLRVGTGIALVVQRDPILLAKEVASLDLVSGGRAVLGVGAGWNREEMRNHGTDPRTRMRLLRERVLAVKELWTEDEAEFHGEFVAFDPVYLYPKPVQDPRPPVMIGGAGPTTFDRVVEYGDGWMPIYGRGTDELAGQIA